MMLSRLVITWTVAAPMLAVERQLMHTRATKTSVSARSAAESAEERYERERKSYAVPGQRLRVYDLPPDMWHTILDFVAWNVGEREERDLQQFACASRTCREVAQEWFNQFVDGGSMRTECAAYCQLQRRLSHTYDFYGNVCKDETPDNWRCAPPEVSTCFRVSAESTPPPGAFSLKLVHRTHIPGDGFRSDIFISSPFGRAQPTYWLGGDCFEKFVKSDVAKLLGRMKLSLIDCVVRADSGDIAEAAEALAGGLLIFAWSDDAQRWTKARVPSSLEWEFVPASREIQYSSYAVRVPAQWSAVPAMVMHARHTMVNRFVIHALEGIDVRRQSGELVSRSAAMKRLLWQKAVPVSVRERTEGESHKRHRTQCVSYGMFDGGLLSYCIRKEKCVIQ